MESCLSHRVLVLNRLWQAVNIVGVRRAFALLAQDHARVIYSDENDFQILRFDEWVEFSVANPPGNDTNCVRTVRLRLWVPKIVLLSHYDRLPMKEVKFTRQNLFERDRFTCQYCGKKHEHRELNLDHVIPRDRGGRTTWENIVTSCLKCNNRKANRLPHEASMRLTTKPDRPKYRPFVSFVLGSEVDDAWSHFLTASSPRAAR